VKSCPWEEVALPASAVVSVLNTNAGIAAPVWGSRTPNGAATSTLEQFAFFETFLDFDQLGLGPNCPGFAVASAKARASTSIDAALHDLAGPFPIDLNTCGKITIIKDTVPSPDPQDFHYTTSGGLSTDAAGFDLDDDANATLSNTREFNNQTPGTFVVTEGTVTGYALTNLTCGTVTGAGTSVNIDLATRKVTITLGNLGEVTCTFENQPQKGAIKLTKTGKDARCTAAGVPHAACTGPGTAVLSGASFSIKQGGTGIPNSPFTTNASGVVCVDNLAFGTYAVKEESAPSGYKADDTASTNITVDNTAACSDATYVGESKAYTNTPLSSVRVIFTSLAGAGVTTSQIVCKQGTTVVPAVSENGTGDTDPPATPNRDDTDETFGNGTSSLEPGVYTCTIDIDP
jgi:uncharacterized surface anchored protein